MKTVILGIGNILLGDDGVGVRALEAIKERYSLPEDIVLIDGGTMGLDLLPFIEGADRLLLIDAVDIGRQPGAIVRIDGEDVPAFLSIKMSVHQIGLPEMLSVAGMMGILPEEVCLIGIQPMTLDTGLSLSGVISNRLDTLIRTVMHRLNEWGIEAGERASVA